jgi:hypothetical protein
MEHKTITIGELAAAVGSEDENHFRELLDAFIVALILDGADTNQAARWAQHVCEALGISNESFTQH